MMGDTYDTAMIHRIHIEPTTIRGEPGQYYRVYYEGAPLMTSTRRTMTNPQMAGGS